MLPITHYNLTEAMETYRRNAEYGIGRIEAVVASGTKQKHIGPKSKLEDFLKLDEVLKPLSSSHTRSGAEESEQDESPDDDNDNDKDVDIDDDQETSEETN